MACGPGEAALALHGIATIRKLFPTSPVWLREDATTDGTYAALEQGTRDDVLVSLSRNPRRRGYHGICKTLVDTFAEVASSAAFSRCDVVVKLDPDALVGSSDLARTAVEVFNRSGPGILGAVHTGPSGIHRDHTRASRNILVDLLPVGPSKTARRVRIGRPFWAAAYRRAVANGYQRGTGVQAGAFVMAAETLRTLSSAGLLSAMPEDYAGLTYEEDTILALAVKSVGHQLHELADTDSDWWVQYRPPVPISPEEAQQRRLLLVHPLKDTERDWALRRSVAESAH